MQRGLRRLKKGMHKGLRRVKKGMHKGLRRVKKVMGSIRPWQGQTWINFGRL